LVAHQFVEYSGQTVRQRLIVAMNNFLVVTARQNYNGNHHYYFNAKSHCRFAFERTPAKLVIIFETAKYLAKENLEAHQRPHGEIHQRNGEMWMTTKVSPNYILRFFLEKADTLTQHQ
jgi:hypothetical protein